MGSGTRTIYTYKLNKVFTSKFSDGYLDRQTLEEDRRSQRMKCWYNTNKDEGISPYDN